MRVATDRERVPTRKACCYWLSLSFSLGRRVSTGAGTSREEARAGSPSVLSGRDGPRRSQDEPCHEGRSHLVPRAVSIPPRPVEASGLNKARRDNALATFRSASTTRSQRMYRAAWHATLAVARATTLTRVRELMAAAASSRSPFAHRPETQARQAFVVHRTLIFRESSGSARAAARRLPAPPMSAETVSTPGSIIGDRSGLSFIRLGLLDVSGKPSLQGTQMLIVTTLGGNPRGLSSHACCSYDP